MFVGYDIGKEDTQPISIKGGKMEHVSKLAYLGSFKQPKVECIVR